MITQLKKLNGPLETAPTDELQEIICAGCDFYSPEKEKLQCGAFKILTALIRKGKVSKDDLIDLGE